MLAERFQQVVDARAEQAAEDQAARLELDNFVKAEFESLDQDFVALVGEATGQHALLSVVVTPITEVITNRAFASLDKHMVEVRSTLYGPLEEIRFTPSLEFRDPNQFGVIHVETTGLSPKLGGRSEAESRALRILERGVLLRGRPAAELAVPAENGTETLSAEILEGFLATLLVRTE